MSLRCTTTIFLTHFYDPQNYYSAPLKEHRHTIGFRLPKNYQLKKSNSALARLANARVLGVYG